jgi:hypothetical protein
MCILMEALKGNHSRGFPNLGRNPDLLGDLNMQSRIIVDPVVFGPPGSVILYRSGSESFPQQAEKQEKP